jgi:hypothetical protein
MRVSVEFPGAASFLGGKVRAVIRAEYFFGGPVAGARVYWSAEGSWWFPWRDDRPSGDDPRSSIMEKSGEDWETVPEWMFSGVSAGDGEGVTGPDGSLEISFDTPPGPSIEPEPGAISVAREFQIQRIADGKEEREDLKSGATVKVGTEILVTVRVTSREGDLRRVCIESPIPAGTEACEDGEESWWDWSGKRELRDDKVTLALDSLGRGEELTYRLRAIAPGTYRALPAAAFEMYDPDRRGASGEFLIRVED